MVARIRYKISLVLAVSVIGVFAGLAYFYSVKQEEYILEQNRIAMERLSDTVVLGPRSVMLTERHEYAPDYAKRLKAVDQVIGLRILEPNGEEAFHDNGTLRKVNRIRQQNHEPSFKECENPVRISLLSENDANLRRAIKGKQKVSYYTSDDEGKRHRQLIGSFPPQIKTVYSAGQDLAARYPVSSLVLSRLFPNSPESSNPIVVSA